MAEKRVEHLVWDQDKPLAEAQPPVMPPEALETVDGLQVMADLIRKEEKIEYCFGVVGSCGTRIDPILQKAGIKRVHTRHEETAGDAADAMGRITGRPGVISIGTGTGASNVAGALLTAKAAQSPVVAIIGEAATQFDKRWTYQGGIRCNMFLPETVKWVMTVYHPAVLLTG